MGIIRTLTHNEYPALLREIPSPPKELYVRGTLPPRETKLLTVVGSRAMSRYGKDACEALIAGLAGYPVAIISGLALGIDTIAHKAALLAGLPTIGVPGSGLDDSVLYPRANFALAKEIENKGGALLSEFDPLWKPRPESFPQRNRIMAGMSHATLVIEAGEKSGTLITARMASDYGRELLIVPHSIFAEGGSGGHIFMKIGATPVRTSADILEALGIEAGTPTVMPDLNEDETIVINMLAEPTPRDELIRSLTSDFSFDVSRANVLLASMELRGLIAESLGEIRKAI